MTLAIELATRKYAEKNTNSTGKNICPIFPKVGRFWIKTAVLTGEESAFSLVSGAIEFFYRSNRGT